MRRRVDNSTIGDGHDSFLDIIANLVGVLIILVMVVTVRARDGVVIEQRASIPTLEPVDVESSRVESEAITLDIHRLDQLLDRQAIEIAYRERERDKILQKLRGVELFFQQRESQLDAEQKENSRQQARLLELQHQHTDLDQARQAVEQMTRQPRVIEHRPTPLAKTVFGTEIHFRLARGRIAYVPWDQLVDNLKRDAIQKTWNLDGDAELTELIGPIGGFRMRYKLAAHRYRANTPDGPRIRQGLRLERFELIPVDPAMGEPIGEALQRGSRFLQTLDSFTPQRATVTVWVYPDGFIQFQQLKEFLHKRGFACAGRPLPNDALISGSPFGSHSSAQ